MRYLYPCTIELDQEEKRIKGRKAYNVTFPDVPEAITCGWSQEEALQMAEDCLGVALTFYVDRRENIPIPSAPTDGQVLIRVPLIIAAKLSLYTAMRSQNITDGVLGKRLGVSEVEVRKLLNLDHGSSIGQIEKALEAVGRTLVLEDIAA
jgi:antitoxin HicB